ncbi:MAG: SufD family Fe-S cluster assembly protein [Clostridia bacterium]|nr:SufD family Fe-S cluster assembly protein [Clostridia bacterium]
MDKIDTELLSQIDDLHAVEQGSFNIRKNGESLKRQTNSDVQIISKKDNSGIDIIVKNNVVNKSVHIPVIVTKGGFKDCVKNDFYIGKNSSVLIVAGCGIHNADNKNTSSHDGVHTFHIGKNSKVVYIEKHLGLGKGEKILNPQTSIYMAENSQLEMQTIQLGGVSYSNRKTKAVLKKDAKLVCVEKILTDDNQIAKTDFKIILSGDQSSAKITSRSVAKGNSVQSFISNVVGKAECFGHVECDGIILDKAIIQSAPKVCAQHPQASLVHEAAIGKIAGDQLIKLQTLGLSEQEAENEIIKGFLN